MSDNKAEIDHVTGVETTGHEWDGIKELNHPLPKWWLYTFYASIVWGVGYMIAYPAWPLLNDYTKGMLGYSQRAVVANDVATARQAQSKFRAEIAKTSIEAIRAKPDLLRFAMAGGKAAFGDNCAPCHGRGAQGSKGYPNLNDDDWLWGGKVTDIHQTILHGIRSKDEESRTNDMPKFGVEGLLEPAQISDTAEYVLSLSGKGTDTAAAVKGKVIFAEQCVACHGENGEGLPELGGPALRDSIWLYGKSKEDVIKSIETGRGGSMPAWATRLDKVTIKSLAIYVHSLGGGK